MSWAFALRIWALGFLDIGIPPIFAKIAKTAPELLRSSMLALLSVPLDRLLHRTAQFETRLEARRACQSGRVSVGGRVAHGNAQVLDPTAAVSSLRLDLSLIHI